MEVAKKLIIGLVVLVLVIAGVGWFVYIRPQGNKQILDEYTASSNTYRYAIVRLPDGSIKEGEVRQYADYPDSDAVKIIFKDGTDLITSYNCAVLSKEKIETKR